MLDYEYARLLPYPLAMSSSSNQSSEHQQYASWPSTSYRPPPLPPSSGPIPASAVPMAGGRTPQPPMQPYYGPPPPRNYPGYSYSDYGLPGVASGILMRSGTNGHPVLSPPDTPVSYPQPLTSPHPVDMRGWSGPSPSAAPFSSRSGKATSARSSKSLSAEVYDPNAEAVVETIVRSTSSQKRKGMLTTRACDECRAVKRKCKREEGATQCDGCVKAKRTCTFSSTSSTTAKRQFVAMNDFD